MPLSLFSLPIALSLRRRSLHGLEQTFEKSRDDKERLDNQAYLGVIEFERDPAKGAQYFEALLTAHPKVAEFYSWFAYAYFWAGLLDKALQVVERGIETADDKANLIGAKANILNKLTKTSEAIGMLEEGVKQFPQCERLYVDLAKLYANKKDFKKAGNRLVQGIQALPHSETLLSTYAVLLSDNRNNVGAATVYHKLIALGPNNPTYHTLLGNAYLSLELHNLAYEAYRKADELAGSKEGWIVANIGNLLSNRGFASAAIAKFSEALRLEPDSQYSHERLATAMTRKATEDDRLRQLLDAAPPVFMLQDEAEVVPIGKLAAQLLGEAVPS